MSKKIHKGQVFGVWKLKKHLGNGGNGDVWLALSSENQEVAVKLLREVKRKTYARFIDEVNVIKANSDVDGILPILDSYLPENPENEIPWYVMPVAQPLEKYLDGKHFEDVVTAIENVAKTLHEFHQRGISHRDIKPENLLVRNGKVYLADFGLVDYPDKINVTSSGDVVGAKWTMAPEMRREGNKSDGKPADVYSLAKTLWILITKNKKGFDGQYHANGMNGLKNFSYTIRRNIIIRNRDRKVSVYESPLDDLLEESTSDNPSSRPTIGAFAERLILWEELNNDWKKRNPIEWQELQKQLFPTTVPQRVFWENPTEIAHILNIVGSIPSLNQLFYPSGGTMDLEGANLGSEPHTVELVIGDRWIDLIRPKRLIFESFGSDSQWNYFRLETQSLEPTGIGRVSFGNEDLVEVEPLHYINSSYWDSGYYDGERLPSSARLVTRHMNGAFVIFSKRSFYNLATSTSDGRHNQMATEEFRNYIAQKVKLADEILRDNKLANLAAEKEIPMSEVLDTYFRRDFHRDHMARFGDGTYDDSLSNEG